MNTHIIAAAWFMSLGAAVAAQTPSQLPPSGPLPESSHSTIGYANVREALEGLRKKPGTQFREQEGWTIVEERNVEKKTSTLWNRAPIAYNMTDMLRPPKGSREISVKVRLCRASPSRTELTRPS